MALSHLLWVLIINLLIQCTKLHETNNTRITPNDIFNEEIDNLKTTAKKIAETLDKLKETAGHPVNPGRATQWTGEPNEVVVAFELPL